VAAFSDGGNRVTGETVMIPANNTSGQELWNHIAINISNNLSMYIYEQIAKGGLSLSMSQYEQTEIGWLPGPLNYSTSDI